MNFGWINWAVLAFFAVGTTFLGHLLKGKQSGMDDFFLGGRSLPWWAVSGSIMATQISAVTIIAVPGAIFRPGGNLLYLQGTLFGFVLAKLLMVLLFVKPFYERKIYSPYDFIENRLGAKAADLSRGLFLVSAILGHGLRLLAVALVLSVVVNMPISQSVFIIGLFAIVWTLMGGITTVIWTDFIMFALMLAGAIISVVTILGGLPIGISKAITELDQAAKMKLIDVSLDPAKTWTLWTGLFCFAIFELAQNSVDQVVTQRMICCRNANEARKAVLGSLGIVFFSLLTAALGLGLWLYYQHFPLDGGAAAFVAENKDAVYPYFIIHALPVGLSGLIIAAIFAAGISTLDSALAALSETTVNGIYRKWIRPDASESQCLRLSKFSVIGWGVVLSLLAYVAGSLSKGGGLLVLAYKLPVLTYGPLLMIALFALARRGKFAVLLPATVAAIATALVILFLNAQGIMKLDELWIYPITCLVFLLVILIAGAPKIPEQEKP
ncbi:MAG: sodium:solute symporter family transporter [Verrucomicrobiales bacterium]